MIRRKDIYSCVVPLFPVVVGNLVIEERYIILIGIQWLGFGFVFDIKI